MPASKFVYLLFLLSFLAYSVAQELVYWCSFLFVSFHLWLLFITGMFHGSLFMLWLYTSGYCINVSFTVMFALSVYYLVICYCHCHVVFVAHNFKMFPKVSIITFLKIWSLRSCSAVMDIIFIHLLFLVISHSVFVTNILYEWPLWL